MFVKLAAAGLSYIMFVALARWLGPEGYGQYAAAFSAGTFLSFVILAGLHTDMLRGLPSLEASKNNPARYAYLKGITRALALSCSVVIFLGVLVAIGAELLRKSDWAQMILMSLAFSGAIALAEYLASTFRALGAVSLALVPRDVIWRLLVIGTVAFFATQRDSQSVVLATTLSICMLLFALSGQVYFGRRLLPSLPSKPQALLTARTFLWHARWLAVAALASNLLQPLAVVMVGIVLSYSESGVFFAAQKTAALLSLPLIAMNMIGAPQIARAWSAGDVAEVQKICTQIALVATAGTLLALAIVLGFSGQLLAIFNPSYRSEGAVLVILALGNLVNTLAGPTGYLMLMTGNEKRFVFISSISQVTGVTAVVVGGAFFDLKGAAMGEVLGVLIFNIAIWRWCLYHLEIDSSILSTLRIK